MLNLTSHGTLTRDELYALVVHERWHTTPKPAPRLAPVHVSGVPTPPGPTDADKIHAEARAALTRLHQTGRASTPTEQAARRAIADTDRNHIDRRILHSTPCPASEPTPAHTWSTEDLTQWLEDARAGAA